MLTHYIGTIVFDIMMLTHYIGSTVFDIMMLTHIGSIVFMVLA